MAGLFSPFLAQLMQQQGGGMQGMNPLMSGQTEPGLAGGSLQQNMMDRWNQTGGGYGAGSMYTPGVSGPMQPQPRPMSGGGLQAPGQRGPQIGPSEIPQMPFRPPMQGMNGGGLQAPPPQMLQSLMQQFSPSFAQPQQQMQPFQMQAQAQPGGGGSGMNDMMSMLKGIQPQAKPMSGGPLTANLSVPMQGGMTSQKMPPMSPSQGLKMPQQAQPMQMQQPKRGMRDEFGQVY